MSFRTSSDLDLTKKIQYLRFNLSHDICEEMSDLPRGRLVQIVVLLTLSFAVLAAPGVDDIETFGGAAEDDPAVGDLVLF